MAVMTARTPTASVSYKPKMRAAAASEANRCNYVTAAISAITVNIPASSTATMATGSNAANASPTAEMPKPTRKARIRRTP